MDNTKVIFGRKGVEVILPQLLRDISLMEGAYCKKSDVRRIVSQVRNDGGEVEVRIVINHPVAMRHPKEGNNFS